MYLELKKEIIKFILDNLEVFNLTSYTVDNFHDYIYSKDGKYLIGGVNVKSFIDDTIKLLESH